MTWDKWHPLTLFEWCAVVAGFNLAASVFAFYFRAWFFGGMNLVVVMIAVLILTRIRRPT